VLCCGVKHGQQEGIEHQIGDDLVEQSKSSLPFPLTKLRLRRLVRVGQIWRETSDAAFTPGDVGSGKTVVAFSAVSPRGKTRNNRPLWLDGDLSQQHYSIFRNYSVRESLKI